MANDAVIHRDFKPLPYWWEAAPPDDTGNLAPGGEADVLVVGGGYTGLNAALELARAGRSVVVCEAEQFGFGASTRNGGGVSAGINLGKGISGGPGEQSNNVEGRSLLDRLMWESRLAFDLVGELVVRESIQCHYEVSGRMVGAYTPAHFKKFSARAETINRLTQADATVLPKARIREEMASDFYHGGLVIERAAKLHPALFMHGLRLAATSAGARLCAHTRVDAVDGGPGQFTVRTSKGTVRCGEVVIGTNGYTGSLTPLLRRGIVPATSHVIATEELPEDLVRGLIPKGRTLSETPGFCTTTGPRPITGASSLAAVRALPTWIRKHAQGFYTGPWQRASRSWRTYRSPTRGPGMWHSPMTMCRTSVCIKACTTLWVATAAVSR
jgi:glycine/D-amino acid oxidase-like deaminating enzyme